MRKFILSSLVTISLRLGRVGKRFHADFRKDIIALQDNQIYGDDCLLMG